MKQTGTILLVLLMAGVATAAIQTDGQHGNDAQYSRGDVKSFTFTDELFQDNDAAMEDAEFRCRRGKAKGKGKSKGKAKGRGKGRGKSKGKGKGKHKGHCEDVQPEPEPTPEPEPEEPRDEFIPPVF